MAQESQSGWSKRKYPAFFRHECPAEEIETLSDIDQAGIKAGRATKSMSRRGVIIAMGYPPPHVTPNLEMDQWMYWMNRFNRNALVFDEDGTLETIVN